jgi:hypothetical protein
MKRKKPRMWHSHGLWWCAPFKGCLQTFEGDTPLAAFAKYQLWLFTQKRRYP